VILAVAGNCEILAQLANEDIDDLGFGLVYAA